MLVLGLLAVLPTAAEATGQQLMLNQRGKVIFDIKDQPTSTE
jgi:hypothetical protein